MIKRCIFSSIRHKHYAQLKINFSKGEQNKQNTKREEKTKKVWFEIILSFPTKY